MMMMIRVDIAYVGLAIFNSTELVQLLSSKKLMELQAVNWILPSLKTLNK